MISINTRIAIFGFCAITGCTQALADTLYERLGGENGVADFVSKTIDLTAKDPSTKRSFDKVDLTKLKLKIAEHICALTDGPCKYTGDTMKLVHQGLDINESEFFAMVEILRGTLNRADVPESAKNELLRILAPMKRDIVSK
ncbi:MAG: group 1 truncated hemoglobin [Betaproteobacteria bacterium]